MQAQALETVHATITELKNKLTELQTSVSNSNIANGFVPSSPYVSPDCPHGYNTAIGYIAETQVELLGNFREPVSDLLCDTMWLRHNAAIRGIKVVAVEAPEAYREYGFRTIEAYPIALLAERLDG